MINHSAQYAKQQLDKLNEDNIMGEEFEEIGAIFGNITFRFYVIIIIIIIIAILLVILSVNIKKKKQKNIPHYISVSILIAALVLVLSPFAIELFF